MTKLTNILKTFTFLVLGASSAAANAVYINGTISAFGSLNTATLGTSSSIVSQLQVLEGSGNGNTGPGTGSYLGISSGTTPPLNPLDISTPTAMAGTLVMQIGTFDFVGGQVFSGPNRVPLFGTQGNLSDAITFRFIGTVSSIGFDASNFLADFTASGNCEGVAPNGPCTAAAPAGAWSMTISSNGAAPGQVPEPATLSLFAIGLAATAANRRRKSAKPVSNSALNEVVCA